MLLEFLCATLFTATPHVASLPTCEFSKSFMDDSPIACIVTNKSSSLPNLSLPAVSPGAFLRRVMSSAEGNSVEHILDNLGYDSTYNPRIVVSLGESTGPHFVNPRELLYCCSHGENARLRVLVRSESNQLPDASEEGRWHNVLLCPGECLFLKEGGAVQAMMPAARKTDRRGPVCKRLGLKSERRALSGQGVCACVCVRVLWRGCLVLVLRFHL